MSVIRQDPTTREWVIVSTERGRRPHEIRAPRPAPARAAFDPRCPFCPGHEDRTPDERYRIPAGDGGGWSVRVVPNKFAALEPDGEPRRTERGRLHREMTGVGHHEVVVESPAHDRILALMSEAEVESVLRAYQARYRALRDDPAVKYVIPFKNHGERAGTSLAHPHSQILATPIAPSAIRRKFEVAVAHYDDTGRCLYRDVLDEEVRAGERVVWRSDAFVVFHPYASRAPFETWIVPTRPQPSFGQAEAADLATLAAVLRRVLRGLYDALGDPDFNLVVHSAPAEDEGHPYYLWHVQILPRVATIAGFELGSGIYITTVLPEESAALMRERLRDAAPA